MFHRRTWGRPVDVTPEQIDWLAERLTEYTWTLCTAWCLDGRYLLLNDATSENGAGEWAVVRRPTRPGEPYRQIESITYGWMEPESAAESLRKILSGAYDDAPYARMVRVSIDQSEDHRCDACA